MSDPDDDFFVGYAPTPLRDRRFFLAAGLALMSGTAALGAGFGAIQARPGPGTWDQADVRDWTGIVTSEPYGMLRTADLDGTPRTALLACLGKCGVAARLSGLAGQRVRVRGSLIRRGRHAMIAVPETEADWITSLGPAGEVALAFPDAETLGEVSLVGEILDSKCWFGAMRPSSGKVHKACASLCIRGGLPPAFFARDKAGRQALMILTSAGQAHGPDLLPLVADPVQVRGTLMRRGDLLMLDAPVAAITRL